MVQQYSYLNERKSRFIQDYHSRIAKFQRVSLSARSQGTGKQSTTTPPALPAKCGLFSLDQELGLNPQIANSHCITACYLGGVPRASKSLSSSSCRGAVHVSSAPLPKSPTYFIESTWNIDNKVISSDLTKESAMNILPRLHSATNLHDLQISEMRSEKERTVSAFPRMWRD